VSTQEKLVFDEGVGVSTGRQEYDPTPVINELRHRVGQWRTLPSAAWGVTPETARLLQHWRTHQFSQVRPFFCQIEAVETAIWLTEVAPNEKNGKRFIEHLASFFVRHAYFLGANDPYGALKTTLKAEINEEAWASLHGDTSRPFEKPKSGRIAVKVINHLGDEVMKAFRV
jgi:hypothetical protein